MLLEQKPTEAVVCDYMCGSMALWPAPEGPGPREARGAGGAGSVFWGRQCGLVCVAEARVKPEGGGPGEEQLCPESEVRSKVLEQWGPAHTDMGRWVVLEPCALVVGD